jgi:hypothetical protein
MGFSFQIKKRPPVREALLVFRRFRLAPPTSRARKKYEYKENYKDGENNDKNPA